ncbi:MAG: DUF2811 domain-containing protein [Cyanobacteria bacterium J06554_6]
MTPTVSLMIEIPEELHTSLQAYLSNHALWNQDRAMQAALSLFLMQNGVSRRSLSAIYLDSLFGTAA